MTIKKVYFLLLLVGGFYVIDSAPHSGPFRSFIIRTERCKKLKYPQHPNPPMNIHFELLNISAKSFFQGNFTVKHYVKNVKTKVKSSLWENGKWKPNYLLPTMGCHGVTMQTIHAMFHVKYDAKYCAYHEGHYTFGTVDTNKCHHKLMSTAEYGRGLWSVETYVMGKQFLTISCWEFEVWIVPI